MEPTDPIAGSVPMLADAPAPVRELAGLCQGLVHRATGILLDYTPETLPLLDHVLRTLEDGTDGGRDLVAAAAGAYFGELVRRCYPCRWHSPPDDHAAWRIEFERLFLWFQPVVLAREAMQEDGDDASPGFRVSAADAPLARAGLDALGEISGEDYTRLSTRFEALSTIVGRLQAAHVTPGAELPVYTAKDYSNAIALELAVAVATEDDDENDTDGGDDPTAWN